MSLNNEYKINIPELGTDNFFETYAMDKRFELSATSFSIGKILANFQTFQRTPNGAAHQTDLVSIYINFDDARALVADYYTGAIQRLANVEKKKMVEAQNNRQVYYAQPVFTVRGGTSAAKLAEKGKARPDGFDEYRSMTIAPGIRQDWVFTAVACAGIQDSKGLINPRKDASGRPMNAKVIRIGVTKAYFSSMIVAIEQELQAYRNAQFTQVVLRDENEMLFGAIAAQLEKLKNTLATGTTAPTAGATVSTATPASTSAVTQASPVTTATPVRTATTATVTTAPAANSAPVTAERPSVTATTSTPAPAPAPTAAKGIPEAPEDDYGDPFGYGDLGVNPDDLPF